ncbi:MAG: endonuclease/exonuclease/phosphatase family protein [Spirochaetaceae bacterium]|jgi:endonuclease/exonuclease/phosphatase family metal-dependent hydrolase|nr:endonuclease/exonuclease/phosphatase family protein [Spirochaetaceae bacterium]
MKHVHGKKNRRLLILTGVLSVVMPALGGCDSFPMPASAAGEADTAHSLSIATWNIQALFDGDENGAEYDEYLNSAGWSEEKYAARLTSLSQAIGKMDEGAPDIVALQELENGAILEELAKGPLAKQGYKQTFFANNPGASLGIGVLSRVPFAQTKAHSVTYNGETSPRPVLELWLQPEDRPLALFICHWKSKLGGDSVTETLRRASARVILRRLQEIERDHPDMPVIIMGDLNENYDEFYRQAGTAVSALLPDDPRAAELAGSEGTGAARAAADYLILSRQKPPRAEYFAPPAIILYSPWGNELQRGSYSYKNEWETIDHFLLTGALFDNRGWEFGACRVLSQPPFTNTNGYPDAYNPRTGHGLSDHLPLLLSLDYANRQL